MVDFNGSYYAYVHTLQGDIGAIIDNTGTKVVEYDYDAWGKPTKAWSLTHPSDSTLTSEYGKLAQLNPFRYRGYVWDEETGMYYLRSRYYDPAWGRFTNEDNFNNICVCSNLYCYCQNNCIAQVDNFGDIAVAAYAAATYVSSTPIGQNILGWFEQNAPWLFSVGQQAVDTLPLVLEANAQIKAGMTPADEAALQQQIVVQAILEAYLQEKRKPINLPSAKRVTLDMEHIWSGHGASGNRGPNKSRFPEWVMPIMAEKMIRVAYQYGERVKSQGDKVKVIGSWGDMVIEIWINVKTYIIESAWPKY